MYIHMYVQGGSPDSYYICMYSFGLYRPTWARLTVNSLNRRFERLEGNRTQKSSKCGLSRYEPGYPPRTVTRHGIPGMLAAKACPPTAGREEIMKISLSGAVVGLFFHVALVLPKLSQGCGTFHKILEVTRVLALTALLCHSAGKRPIRKGEDIRLR